MAKEKKVEIESSVVLKGLLRIINPMKWVLLLAIVFNSLFSLANVTIYGLMKIIMDVLFTDNQEIVQNNDNLDEYLSLFYNFLWDLIKSPTDNVQTIVNLSVLLLSLFVIKNIFKYIGTVFQTKVNLFIVKDLRDKLLEKLTFLPLGYFTKSKQGELISIATNDVEVLNQTIVSSSTNSLRALVEFLTLLIGLILISPYLTMIAIGTSIASVFFINISRKFLKRYSTRMQEAMADFTTTMQETIGGMRIISAFMAQKKAINKFKNSTDFFVKSNLKHRKVFTMVPAFTEFFGIAALCVVLIFGGSEVYKGEMSGSILMTFITMLFALMQPVQIMVTTVSNYQRGIVAGRRVFSVLEQDNIIKDGKINFKSFEDEIEIKNLTFGYENEIVLKDINMRIKKGEKVALVGGSGSGKSTLLDLVIRFYDPIEGSISYDGIELTKFNKASMRQHIGVVSQETILFNDTIANNLRYAKPNATAKEIEDALKTANAFNFVEQLPNGIETEIGERGLMLSGGERQRLSIARALIRNPEILIFDEATSALDSESEMIVQSAINDSLANRTALIVAHRLATILNCDRIFVFDNGEIVESGSYQELLEKNGLFKKLHDIQFNN